LIGSGSGAQFGSARNNCIFIGHGVGYFSSYQDVLLIENSGDVVNPLIYGEFNNNRLVISGNETHNTNNRTFFVNGSAGGTGAWFNDSDRRYKKNIKPLQSALDKVLQIEGVSYEWDNQNYPNRNYEKGTHIGFIAQDLEKVVPEVVNTASGEAGYKSVAYAPLTALLVEAVKEQQTQIDSDKAELEQQLENQQQTINQQQAAIDEQQQTIENQQKLIEQMMEQLQSINQKLEGND